MGTVGVHRTAVSRGKTRCSSTYNKSYVRSSAILYVLCQGCTWRALLGDLPPWSTVYGYFRR
ncbi:Mobile element protein [Richelia intracellularis]|nr:Mobile element protein [Richelia intracellularis]